MVTRLILSIIVACLYLVYLCGYSIGSIAACSLCIISIGLCIYGLCNSYIIYRKKVKKLKKSLLFHMVYNRLIKQSIDCVKYAAPQYYSTAVFWKAEYIRLGYVCISHDNRGDEYDFEM